VKLQAHMMGDIAGYFKEWWPSALDATIENCLLVMERKLAPFWYIGINHFKGRALVRFVEQWVENDRRFRADEDFTEDMHRLRVAQIFCEGAAVYDEAMRAYNETLKKVDDHKAVTDAEYECWDRER